ncbi:MAG TPA: PAS domain-containing protein [Dongiaceae bacterium]|nr:PAS domain-containing protein [Dongiaceae bacterium]
MPKPVVTLDLSDLNSPRIHRLHAYWMHQRDKRGGRLPRRGDIAPDQIRDLLPNIMIVDVERDPMRFRYRLVGTRVVEYNGVEFTGRYLGEIGWPEEQDLIDSYAFVVNSRRPFFGLLDWELVTGAVGRCEFGRLPLSEDGEAVTQILAMEDYDFPQLDALPSGGGTTR